MEENAPAGGSQTTSARPDVVALCTRLERLALAGDDLPTTLRTIVEEMARDGLRGACIALVNDRSELYIAAWQGTVDRAVLDLRLPLGQGVMGTVAAEGRPIVVADYDEPPAGLTLPTRSVGTNRLSRSCCAVPIWSDGVAIGVLQMGSARVGAFGDEDVTLLTAVAETISEAVRRAEPGKLANELLRRRVTELTFLQDAAAALRSSLEPADVARQTVEFARRGLSTSSAVLVDVGEAPPAILACEPVRSLRPGEDRPLPEWAQAALRTGRCILAVHPEWAGTWAAALGTPPAAVACAALQHGDRRALLIVESDDPRGFDPAQARLLDGLADIAALALDNAHAYLRLREAARRDPLTGLLTRAAFEETLRSAAGRTHSVLAMDLDNLRMVNDVHGHEAGDQVIRVVSGALGEALQATAILGRVAGDEFAAVVPDAGEEEVAGLAELVRSLMHGVQVPFGIARMSVGHATGHHGDDPQVTWERALAGLRSAKRWGRDRVAPAGAASEDDPQWEALLEATLDTHGVRAVYQPILPLAGGPAMGYEALARPSGFTAGGAVGGLFAAAQATGRARDLDWLCRRAAVHDAHALPAGVPIFVNVGVFALLDPLHDVDQMLLLLRWARRDPAHVVLEITEREAVGDLPRFREVLAQYREHGFRFALDDVGEGHSTLEVLAASSAEYIKLASGLVTARDDRGAAAAVRAVVAFAASNGASVVAEGIETEDDLQRMLDLGVDLGQGWLLGRPAEAGAMQVAWPLVSAGT